jgi:hypothetical protein
MRLARRTLLVAVAVVFLLGAIAGQAQTVSQKCVDSVQRKYPEVSSAWVVTALTRGDVTELRWRSASGLFGICTMARDGNITDVKSSGRDTSEPSDRIDLEELAVFEPYFIECDSSDGERTECPVEPDAVIELIDVLGDSECTLDVSWGHLDDVVWVDDGCHGRFNVRPARTPLQPLPIRPTTTGSLDETVSQPELRTLKGRAENACLREVSRHGVQVTHHYGTRTEGAYIIVLIGVGGQPQAGFMGADAWTPRGDVTCRYDPTNDRAIIAR